MYVLEKRFRFEAAHVLPKHGGKCARLHGHSWQLVVRVGRVGLETDGPRAGMAVDFGDIKEVVQPLVDDHLDHYHLNESTGLEHPTSEHLARWVFGRIVSPLAKLGVTLLAVIIEETCTSRCEYKP